MSIRSRRLSSIGRTMVVQMWLLTGSALAQGPIMHLPFDGNAADISGNGHHGVNYGAQATSDRFGRPARALAFDGSANYVRVPYSPQFNCSLVTVSMWVKFCYTPPSVDCFLRPFGPVLFGRGFPPLGAAPSYRLMISCVPTFCSSIDDLIDLCTRTAGFNDSRWHHVVMQLGNGAGSYQLVVDGVTERVGDHGIPILGITADAYIGRNLISNRHFEGAIDDVRFYNRTVSSDEIQALYTEGGWPGTSIPRVDVTIPPPPTLPICPGDSVVLRATMLSGTPDSVVWRPAPGLSPVDRSNLTVTVRPDVTTTYRVYVSVGSPCAESKDSADITITVRPGPKLPRLGPYVICPGDSVRIGGAAFGGTPPYRYQWRAAPGIVNAGDSTQRVSPATSRWYYVEVVDANNCRHRDSALVAVPGYPKLALPARRLLCRGTPDTIGVAATGGSGGGYRYRWSPSAGLSEDSAAFPLMLADTSRRYVLRVTDGNGCSSTDTMDVVVVDPPVADAGSAVSLCADSSVVLGAPVVAGHRYRWSPALGLNDTTLAQPTARPDTTTTYRLEVTDTTTGCRSIDSVEAHVVRFAMAAAPATLDFGRLDGCASSRDLTLALRNRGDGPLTIGAAVGTTRFVVIAPLSPLLLNPGDTGALILRYAPQGAGVHVDTLELRADRCGIVERIVLVGAKDAAIASVGPNALDLGARLVCDTSVASGIAWVHNLGGDPMTISGVTVDAPFRATSITLPATIGPGDSLAIAFTLPTRAGVWSGEGRIAYASGRCRDTLRVTLRGEVVEPRLAFPDPFDIGVITGCVSHRDTTVMVSNATSVPMTIARIDGGAIVSSAQSLPMVIDPATAASLRIRVEPLARGPFSERVSVRLAECDTTIAFTVVGDYRGVVFMSVDTVDFGQVIACGDTTVSMSFELSYGGGGVGTGRVVNARVEAPFTVDSMAGARLDSGVVYRARVHFTPTSDGTFSGRMTLTLEPCGATREIALVGSRTSARLVAEPPVIDLGMVNPGVTATGEIIYVNRGSVAARVERVGGIAPPFTMQRASPSLPASISPGETLRVVVGYAGQSGIWIDTVEATVTEPCSSMAGAEIRGGTNQDRRARLSVKSFSAKAGDHERITIALGDADGLESAGVRSLEVSLRFDASLLYVESNQANVTHRADSVGWKRVRVRGALATIDVGATGVDVVALLGQRDRTAIVLEDARWLDANGEPIAGIATGLESGEFVLDGVCRQGSDRHVDGLGEFFLRNVIPTPTHGVGEIEFGLVEDGEMRLDVVDMQGRVIGGIVTGSPGAGVYRVGVDARGLSAGVYMVILRAGRGVATVRMVVE